MSRKDTILRAAQRTAKEAREAASRKSKRRENSGIPHHRHCSICWKPITLESVPPVCSNEECADSWKKKDKSRKRLTIMMYFFPAFAILLLIMNILQQS